MAETPRRARIARPFAELRRGPAPDSAMETEALYGQVFIETERRGERSRGKLLSLISDRVDYEGWLDRSALEGAADGAMLRVTALSAPVFASADIKSPVRLMLPRNARILPIGDDGAFSRTVDGFVHRAHLAAAPRNLETVLRAARDHLGRPYVWGGTGGQGLDCSGLVQSSLAVIGLDAPRDAGQQETALGRPVALDKVQPGDLVFWPGHVGFAETQGRLLHANAHHMMTAREPLAAAIARIGDPRSIRRLKV